MATQLFANYPEPRLAPEAPATDKAPKEDENPVLRGLPLAIAASM